MTRTDQIAEQLAAEIREGVYRIGERFATNAALAQRFHVSTATTSKVKALLLADGLLIRGPGRDMLIADH